MVSRARTTSESATAGSYPNKLGRVVLTAAEQVMGLNGLKTILTQARLQHLYAAYPANNHAREFSFEDMGRLLRALDEMYGRRTGRRLARRIGRRCFALGTTDLPLVLLLARVTFRLLPLETRLRVGLEVAARVMGRYTGHPVRLRENEEHYYWVTENCGFCWLRSCSSPCCDVLVGLVEEAVSWIARGGDFSVEETTCVALGDSSCTIQIGKQPLN